MVGELHNLARSGERFKDLMKGRLNYMNTKLVSVQITSGKCDTSVTSSFSKTKGFFCFSFNKGIMPFLPEIHHLF